MMKPISKAFVSALFCALRAGSAHAGAVENFYRGKQMQFIIREAIEDRSTLAPNAGAK